jgi:hypothetical protein
MTEGGSKFLPRLLIGLGIGLAFGLVLLVVGGHWWLERYLHSDEFRKLISAKMSKALRAEGEFLPLHWSGTTAYSDGFRARGLPGTALRELRAERLRAELSVSGLFRNEWRVSGLEVEQLNVSLASATGGETTTGNAGAPSAAESAAARVSASKSSMKLMMEPMRVNNANIEWVSGATTGALRRAQLTVAFGDNACEAGSSGGEVVLPGLQPLRIEQAQVRFQRETLFVTDSLLRLTEGGKVTVNGQVATGGTGNSSLALRFEEAPIERWLPKDWRGRLIGKARGESFVRGQPGDATSLSATGTVTLVDGRMEALPFLNQLAVFTGSEQFRRLQLDKARTDFAWSASRLELRRLLVESTGLLRVEGGCVVEKNMVHGEFDVGVASSTLRWLPGAKSRVFTVGRDGYQWTKVRVEGPTDDIREDLTNRLLTAAGTEIIEGTKDVIQKGTSTILDMFHKITQ